MADPRYTLDAASVRRLDRTNRQVERAYKNPVLPGRNPYQGQAPNRIGVVASTIGAGSTASPGSGTVDLYTFDPESGTTSADPDGEDVTVYNNMNGSVAVGASVQLKWIDGALWVDTATCPP